MNQPNSLLPEQRLYMWDSMSNEITVWEQDCDIFDPPRGIDTGWHFSRLLSNGTVVLRYEQHFAMETWAKDIVEAFHKFQTFGIFCEKQDRGNIT